MKTDTDATEKYYASPEDPMARVDTDRLAALLREDPMGRSSWLRRFDVFRTTRSAGRLPRCFTSGDICEFAKLVPCLVTAQLNAGPLDDDLRQELSSLAVYLADVLGYQRPCDDPRPRPTMDVYDAVNRVVRRLWVDAGRDFERYPFSFHIYRHLVLLDRWLAGVVKHDDVFQGSAQITVDDRFGVCPLCGKTDGYFNLRRSHWFVCHEHQLRWFAGSNLFSSWKKETREQWRKNWEAIGRYRIVVPWSM